jgi:hypothetical protein
MSQVANKMSNNNSNQYAKKPFCKVCFDAGKADTAHFIRKTPDPKSQVTCPTLLALECRYCFQHGHTVKYCTVLQKQDRDIKHKTIIGQNPTQTQTPIKNSNKFAAFADEDDLEQLEQLQQQLICEQRIQQFPKLATNTLATQTLNLTQQFPKLTTTTTTNTNQTTTTNKWAAMASVAANKPIPITIIKPITITITQQTNTKWADDDDDEDADDDLEEDIEDTYAPVYAPVAHTYTHYTANDDDW